MTKIVTFSERILGIYSGSRLDYVVAQIFPEHSRNHIKNWILLGALTMDGKSVKPSTILKGGELIELYIEEQENKSNEPESIPLSIVWEDESILVINKPHGLVVHPGAGNKKGTLLNALLNYEKDLGYLPRAGIVHRLDKDTSGIMMVAKTEVAYLNLVNQLKERTVRRKYLALVVGSPISGGIIDEPIGRHPVNRTKQSVIDSGKRAITEYKIKSRLGGYTLLSVLLKTGRTHQIRVHLSFKNFPIVGDKVYGIKKRFAPGTSEEKKRFIGEFSRQALHAQALSFIHPIKDKKISLSTELPNDFKNLIKNLEKDL